MLKEPGIVVAPGAYDALTAKIIQNEGFKAVYMTGGGTSVTQIGRPDLGLTTLTEMIGNASNIADTVDVPVICDADTGYGGVLNVQRTVRQYEKAGVAAIHIEDQGLPKRCGHLEDKLLVPAEEMALKIEAAVDARTDEDFTIIVRTDSLAGEGMDQTLKRCEKYVEAGAQVLFIEALRTPEEAERVVKAFDVPMLYNFAEKGKSPLIPVDELEKLGFKIVIFPASAMATVCKVVTEVMREIKEKGTTERLLGNMVSLVELFETVGLSDMLEAENRYTKTPQPTR
jgi:carboxyvinyl-carboxyphosphonate phosphorylmutase